MVKKNIPSLEKAYADDFVFSHGSGKVEGKAPWLKSAGRGLFLSRKHDSVKVEMHPDVAVVKGKLSVAKTNKEKTDRYHLYYIIVVQNSICYFYIKHQQVCRNTVECGEENKDLVLLQ